MVCVICVLSSEGCDSVQHSGFDCMDFKMLHFGMALCMDGRVHILL